MKVKILKDYKEYDKGEIVEVTRNVGFGLIDSGIAIAHKMMTSERTKVKNGKSA